MDPSRAESATVQRSGIVAQLTSLPPDVVGLAANSRETWPQPLDLAPGPNRREGHNQLGADDDVAAARHFLVEYERSPNTRRAYAKEVERLLLWARLTRHKSLSALDRADFAAYADFLCDPQPASVWCGPRRGRHVAAAPTAWRPFVGPLGPAARRAALAILHSFLSYLVQARYLRANPLALLRQRSKGGPHVAGDVVLQRAFDAEEWAALLAELDAAPPGDGARERERYVVAMLYFLALRVGELTTHTMGDMRQVRGRWQFFVVGKGCKPAQLPVNETLLAAVGRYRETLGLPPQPQPHETTPLVPAGRGPGALSARRINQIIKALMARVARRLLPQAPHKATHVACASAHWFRHTSLTRQAARGIPLAHLKANARHSRLDTTMLYVHAQNDARHDEMQQHTWT